jgi:glucose-1-phosphatase
MITTILFDWGGVLTIGSFTASICDVLERRLHRSKEDICSLIDPLIVKMDRAEITVDEFILQFNELFESELSLEDMKNVFRQARVFNGETQSLVKKLKDKYRLVLASNNNALTVGILRDEHKDVLDLFERAYFSHEMKLHKPQLEFFKFILGEMKVSASECVFIDDKQENVDAAASLGIHAILFTGNAQLKKELEGLGVE